MSITRLAIPSDLNQIYALSIYCFGIEGVKREEQQKIFCQRILSINWDNSEHFKGYVLEDQSRIVGFIGYIFSKRLIDRNEHIFCNLSTWAVEPEYRNESLNLVFPIRDLKGVTMINFTPSVEALKVFKKLYKFKSLEDSFTLVPPSLFPNAFWKVKTSYIGNDEHLLKVARDHQSLPVKFMYVSIGSRECLVVYRTMNIRRLRFAFVLHISNKELFHEKLSLFRNHVLLKNHVAMMIDNRLLGEKKILFSKSFPLKQQRIYRSELPPEKIDNLYSEFVF